MIPVRAYSFLLVLLLGTSQTFAQSGQTIFLNAVAIDIKQGRDTSAGDILVLPGWNFPRSKWCDSSDLCSKAIKLGYRLVMPEMGKSIYASHYYPETRKDWLKYPTLSWLCDTMIPYLQKNHGLFKGKKNYILGLSTGARGVVMVAIKTDTLFTAGAALSGDYDQTTEPADNLIKGVYGSYSIFKERWQNEDNPAHDIAKLKTPIYFGHGSKDNVVPFNQTKSFYGLVKKTNPNTKSEFHSLKAGHNFKYWGAEVDSILKYFQKF